ncbi:MAG: hypothetical protein JRL30_07575 [Deltaproteobacteria bacterium]|nr:hypothetical protein [Deltaproteobacteria bacterium]
MNIDSHSGKFPAKTGMRLNPGDTVSSLGGTASVILSDGKMLVVKRDASFTLPADSKAESRETLIVRMMGTVGEISRIGKGPTIKAMVRGVDVVMLVYPFNSCITSDQLRFEWERIEGVEGVEIFLKSPSPAYRYSFTVEPGKNKVSLPKDSPQLLPDTRYYWKVKGTGRTEPEALASKLCWFSILGQEKITKMNAEMSKIDTIRNLDKNDRDFLKATLLISYGLYHRAAGILKRQLQESPEDKGIKELLTGLFKKTKNFREAAKYQ